MSMETTKALPREFNKLIANLATGTQLEYYKMYCDGNTFTQIGKAFGVNRKSPSVSIAALEKKAVSQGLLSAYDDDTGVGLGRTVGKVTTHVKGGAVVQEWVRTDEKQVDMEQKVRDFISVLSDQIPVRDYSIVGPSDVSEKLLSVYNIADQHLGMYAWAEESGNNFDCDMCEAQMVGAIDRLVDTQPCSRVGRIQNLGDMFHSDNEKGITERSGNFLDTDGRYGRVLRIGVRMMTHCIDRALEKHERVEVINVPGNHDSRTSYCLAIILAEHYREEPRVFVDTQYTEFFYREFGSNLIGANHGMIKPQRLMEVMACDMPEAWGRTKHRYWHVGHFHTTKVTEIGGVIVEAFRSLKPKDAYEAASGYRAGREMHALLYHETRGLVERHICSIDWVEE